MYRSASSGRVSDEFLMYPSPSSSPPRTRASLGNGGGSAAEEELPTYDPQSHAARKERSRLRSAENAIHLIPLLLIFCAVVLWFFSHPEAGDELLHKPTRKAHILLHRHQWSCN